MRVLGAALVIAAVFASSAEAFHGPMLKSSRIARSAAVQSAQPVMSFDGAASQLTTNVLLASKETDFGGYTGPAVGLVVVFVLIALLTNPYDDTVAKRPEKDDE